MKCRENEQNEHNCGYANKRSTYFTLTAPTKCSTPAQTIFHELLHVTGIFDNQTTHNHNNGACKGWDAVYHCSHFCFRGSSPTDSQGRNVNYLQREGCNACVKEDRARRRYCGRLSTSNTYNMQNQHCGR